MSSNKVFSSEEKRKITLLSYREVNPCRLNRLDHIETRGRARHNDVNQSGRLTSRCSADCMFSERFSKYNMDTWTVEDRTHSHGSTVCEETTRSLFGGTTQDKTFTKSNKEEEEDVEEKKSENG